MIGTRLGEGVRLKLKSSDLEPMEASCGARRRVEFLGERDPPVYVPPLLNTWQPPLPPASTLPALPEDIVAVLNAQSASEIVIGMLFSVCMCACYRHAQVVL